MIRFVFLDRDGTLVRDRGFTHRVADYRLLDGVVEGLLHLQRGGYRLAVVTNQSGIGRGYYTWSDYRAFQAHLRDDLGRRGVRIEAEYCCPHAPNEGCECRKPQPGMLWRARAELGADLSQSWVVGDRETDVCLAQRAELRGAVWLRAGSERRRDRDPLGDKVFEAPDLRAAARLILAEDARPAQTRPG